MQPKSLTDWHTFNNKRNYPNELAVVYKKTIGHASGSERLYLGAGVMFTVFPFLVVRVSMLTFAN